MELLAKTFQGLEQVLADELIALGATQVKQIRRAVSFHGDTKILYKVNYQCRTALRILVPIATFHAKDYDIYYNEIKKIDWSQYMDVDQTLAVDAVSISRIFTHSQYLGQKTKDAIVDQVNQPDLLVSIFIHEDRVIVSLDSSGDTLNKRGYRLDSVDAPINEVLAAGMIGISKWDCKSDFFDPMCGSGTFLIEAAMLAHKVPAQYMRDYFTFKKWKNFDENIWKEVVKEADESIIKDIKFKIYGSDFNFQTVRIAERNVEAIRLEDTIKIMRKDFFKTTPPVGTFVMMNPPYDERMALEDVGKFYSQLGHHFKQSYGGTTIWMISSQKEFIGNIPMRPSSTFNLLNGAIECKFVKYEVFQKDIPISAPKLSE
jgi:putative N6-adenine-specific DNA methylase